MKGFIVAVLLVSVIAVANGIHCYTCVWGKGNGQEEGKNCKKPDDDAPSIDCPGGITRCMKAELKTDDLEGRARSCAPPGDHEEKCTEGDTGIGGQGTVCFCSGDKCNGASSLVSGFAILPAVLGTAYALRQ